ncbi:MAG: MerR family transcriptional regulator [Tatlockia sp.]|nr:MerR family transcriptional regulator [Tatlockia sp.]
MTKDKDEPALDCDQWYYLSLTEVSSSFGIPKETVLQIVEEGIVNLKKDNKDQWLFDNQSLLQIRRVLSLTQDLGVNFAGAGLALELLEEIEHLRAQLSGGQTKVQDSH